MSPNVLSGVWFFTTKQKKLLLDGTINIALHKQHKHATFLHIFINYMLFAQYV